MVENNLPDPARASTPVLALRNSGSNGSNTTGEPARRLIPNSVPLRVLRSGGENGNSTANEDVSSVFQEPSGLSAMSLFHCR